MATRIRYCVAMSLDGYITGPNGEADWIVMDPDMDFAQLWAQFDTLLMGRRTFEAASRRLGAQTLQTKRVVVSSRTLRTEDHPEITVISEINNSEMQKLRQQSQKDIWLMGGGELFRALLKINQVDTIEVSTVPVLLGSGISLLPSLYRCTRLKLASHKVYNSGVVSLDYDIQLTI